MGIFVLNSERKKETAFAETIETKNIGNLILISNKMQCIGN